MFLILQNYITMRFLIFSPFGAHLYPHYIVMDYISVPHLPDHLQAALSGGQLEGRGSGRVPLVDVQACLFFPRLGNGTRGVSSGGGEGRGGGGGDVAVEPQEVSGVCVCVCVCVCGYMSGGCTVGKDQRSKTM